MHSPGICGIILASSSPAGAQAGVGDAPPKTKAEAVSELIGALNTDTEMVLVTLGAGAEALAPTIWTRAAYVVQLPPDASDAVALRAALREVLNRGRDTALVAALDDQALTAETVRLMVAVYCAAGDEVWAVVPEPEMRQGHPVLMGRRMIELFLRGQQWSTADQIVSAYPEHLRRVKAGDAGTAVVEPGASRWE